MDFVGRERELERLESIYAKGGVKTVMMYGRRKVGKSTLLKRFCDGKRALYIQSPRGSAADVLHNLALSISAFDGKESIEQLDGVWIGEVAELLALTKTKEQEAVKQYITRQRDRNRRPYSERIEEIPRRCIFIGTTNNEQFLRDKTGNRRFYPVTVHSNGYWLYSHEQECRDYILQCWAEAKARYDEGKLPAVADPLLVDEYKRAQDDAVEDDWRVGAIEAYLEEKEPGELVCVREIMRKALSPNPDFPKDPSPKDSQEISIMMAKNFPEWERIGLAYTKHYGRQRCWKKTDSDSAIEGVDWVT